MNISHSFRLLPILWNQSDGEGAKSVGFLCDFYPTGYADDFSPHCFRHWFTAHLLRSEMPREFIQELRGDARKEAIDVYDHIDRKELSRKLPHPHTAAGDIAKGISFTIFI